MKILSIITITKDDFQGLASTIKSLDTLVHNQKKVIDIIVIDGSKKSIQIMNRDYCMKAKVRYYYRKPAGVADAFNYGLKKTCSEWVWFLNGGDYYNRNIKISIIDYLNSTVADLVIGEVQSQGKISKRPSLWYAWPPTKNWIPHPSVISRSELIRSAGGFDTSYKAAMDGDIWYKIIKPDIRLDLISIPLSNFSLGGISSNTEIVEHEMKLINKKYFYSNVKYLLGNIYRYIKDTLSYKLS